MPSDSQSYGMVSSLLLGNYRREPPCGAKAPIQCYVSSSRGRGGPLQSPESRSRRSAETALDAGHR
jgi:hypothetical protein